MIFGGEGLGLSRMYLLEGHVGSMLPCGEGPLEDVVARAAKSQEEPWIWPQHGVAA